VNVFFDVIRGITIIKGELPAAGPNAILGGYLGCVVETYPRILTEDLAEQFLAVPIAISPGGVKEI
jgi:hypothetical protein